MNDIFEFQINNEDVGLRLDVFIEKYLNQKSRSNIQKLINDGFVRLDNAKHIKASYKVKLGQKVIVEIPKAKELEITAQNIPIEIIYQDEDIAVVNKPKGMVVHPACGNYSGTLVNALLFNCSNLSGINGVIRPGIVHRIDKETSGILVAAKNDKSHIHLSNQLKEHSMKRVYFAVVYGNIKEDSGKIDTPIGRHRTDRKKMCVLENGSRNAVTHFEVLERFNGFTFIKARLETGRTHQIRVHMTFIGHPIVGDKVYGPKKQKLKAEGQILHAGILGFIHPATNDYLEFEAPLPEDFEKILKNLRETKGVKLEI